MESRTKSSKVAENDGVPRNTTSTWLLPENKKISGKKSFKSAVFEEDRLTFHLQNHVDKFNVLY